VDWTGLLRDTWRIMRRTPALWGLGTVSALQAGMYGLIVVGLIAPMTALTQLLVQMQTAPAGLGTGSGAETIQEFLPGAIAWIQRWEPALLAGIVAIVALWAVLGVLDVAATGGAISQTEAVVEGREATVGEGMRDGFKVWWRTVGLLAIAALPALSYLLVVALFTLFTISIPLRTGAAPDLSAISAGNAVNGVLSSAVGLIGIPLGVLVMLGLRYAVLEHQEWRAAFSSAWRLAGANFGDVVLMYLLQLGVSLGAAIVLTVAFGVLFAIAGVAIAVLVAAAHAFSGAAMFVTLIAILLASLLALAYSVAIIVWFSVVWTLFWRRITGRELRRVSPAPPMFASPADGYVAGTAAAEPYPQQGSSRIAPDRPAAGARPLA